MALLASPVRGFSGPLGPATCGSGHTPPRGPALILRGGAGDGMAGTTWSKFFWSDWRSDPGLRACGYAARGLWMDMLAIMAEAEPIGYLVLGGQPISIEALARITGGLTPEVKTLADELARNGVYSVDRHERIFSRRMVREAKKAQTAQKNGKMGGNPNLRKEKEIRRSDNLHPNHPDNQGVAPMEESPESRVHRPDSESADRSESPTITEPRREGGAGGAADADRPAALPEDRPVTGGAPAKPKAPRKPKVQRTRLAPDWTPTPAQRSYAHVAGLEDPKIDFIAVGFLRYWTGADAKNPLKADWDRTWENWVDREIANGALRSNGRVGSAGHRPEPDSGLARFLRRNLGADGQPEFSAGGRVDPPISGMAPPGPRVRPGPIDGFGPGAIDLEPDAETGAYRVAGRTPGDDTVES